MAFPTNPAPRPNTRVMGGALGGSGGGRVHNTADGAQGKGKSGTDARG